MLIITGLLFRFPTNRPTYTVAERAKLVMGPIMFASKAPPLLRWYPCPARGPLLANDMNFRGKAHRVNQTFLFIPHEEMIRFPEFMKGIFADLINRSV